MLQHFRYWNHLQKFSVSNLSLHCCILCEDDGETANHIFIHCILTNKIWCRLLNLFCVSWPVSLKTIMGLLSGNFGKGANKKVINLWRCDGLALLCCIWLERNKQNFKEKEGHVELIWDRIIFLASLWSSLSKHSRHLLLDWGAGLHWLFFWSGFFSLIPFQDQTYRVYMIGFLSKFPFKTHAHYNQ